MAGTLREPIGQSQPVEGVEQRSLPGGRRGRSGERTQGLAERVEQAQASVEDGRRRSVPLGAVPPIEPRLPRQRRATPDPGSPACREQLARIHPGRLVDEIAGHQRQQVFDLEPLERHRGGSAHGVGHRRARQAPAGRDRVGQAVVVEDRAHDGRGVGEIGESDHAVARSRAGSQRALHLAGDLADLGFGVGALEQADPAERVPHFALAEQGHRPRPVQVVRDIAVLGGVRHRPRLDVQHPVAQGDGDLGLAGRHELVEQRAPQGPGRREGLERVGDVGVVVVLEEESGLAPAQVAPRLEGEDDVYTRGLPRPAELDEQRASQRARLEDVVEQDGVVGPQPAQQRGGRLAQPRHEASERRGRRDPAHTRRDSRGRGASSARRSSPA